MKLLQYRDVRNIEDSVDTLISVQFLNNAIYVLSIRLSPFLLLTVSPTLWLCSPFTFPIRPTEHPIRFLHLIHCTLSAFPNTLYLPLLFLLTNICITVLLVSIFVLFTDVSKMLRIVIRT